jgi:hypothetical protein
MLETEIKQLNGLLLNYRNQPEKVIYIENNEKI